MLVNKTSLTIKDHVTLANKQVAITQLSFQIRQKPWHPKPFIKKIMYFLQHYWSLNLCHCHYCHCYVIPLSQFYKRKVKSGICKLIKSPWKFNQSLVAKPENQESIVSLCLCFSVGLDWSCTHSNPQPHHCDVIMSTIASQITSLPIVYSTVYSGTDQRKHQSSASLAFVWGNHRDRWIPRTNGQ